MTTTTNAAAATPTLSATDVTVRFGGVIALADVAIDVPPGTIVGLVGPNGAGKSTLFGVLSGLLRPAQGRVFIGGHDVTTSSAKKRARLGLARTFQHPELFMDLTVRDHLVLGYRTRYDRRRFWSDLVDFRAFFAPSKSENEHVESLLELLDLTAIADTRASVLPLGLARLVEVGRALATDPTVVLLDEPLSGLDVHTTQNLTAAFRRVVSNSGGRLSLLMVEHDVASVLALSTKIFVLDFGQLIAEGSPEEVRADPAVRAAYLGDEDATAAGSNGAGSNAAGSNAG